MSDLEPSWPISGLTPKTRQLIDRMQYEVFRVDPSLRKRGSQISPLGQQHVLQPRSINFSPITRAMYTSISGMKGAPRSSPICIYHEAPVVFL